jgi:uncharacterized protein YndB with AHSA1/START domain
MIKTEVTVIIQRPIEEVFAYVTDVGNFPQWAGAVVVESRQTSPGPMGVGTTFTQVNRFLVLRFTSQFTVKVYRPPTEWVYQTTAGLFQFTGHYTFAPVAEGTRFISRDRAVPGGILKLFAPLLQGTSQHQVEGNLAKLKGILDAGA